MTTDDGLEALLAEHRWDIARNTPHCNCGVLAYSITAHVAAVVRAAGWRQGREEWGIRVHTSYLGGRGTRVEPVVDEETSRDPFHLVFIAHGETIEGRTPVHRYVTDWEET